MFVLNCVLEHHVLIHCMLFIKNEASKEDFNLLIIICYGSYADVLEYSYFQTPNRKWWNGIALIHQQHFLIVCIFGSFDLKK